MKFIKNASKGFWIFTSLSLGVFIGFISGMLLAMHDLEKIINGGM